MFNKGIELDREILLEFNEGNFDEEGNRILPYGEFRAKLNKEGKI